MLREYYEECGNVAYQLGNVLKAVFAKLNGDVTLSALIDGVYVSEVPKNASYPCVVIGSSDITSVPLNTFNKKGKESAFVIYVHDTSRSDLEIVAIAERIDVLLDWTDLTISGNSHIVTAITNTRMGIDVNSSEGTKTRYTSLQYKIMTQES